MGAFLHIHCFGVPKVPELIGTAVPGVYVGKCCRKGCTDVDQVAWICRFSNFHMHQNHGGIV